MAYLKTESAQRSNRCLGARFNRAGFTMIEILVSLAVFGIVITGVYQVYLNFNSHATAQEEVAEMQQNVRVAINQITRELRSAGYRFGSPVDGIITSSPQSTLILDENTGNFLTIQGDFDNNNVIEKVTYAISCTEVPCEHPWLMRTYDDGSVGCPPSERFAANIEEVEFKLYDKNNGPETVASNARRVTVKLRGRTDRPDPDWPSDGGYRLRTVSADVILRNFELSTGDITPPVCPTTTGVTAVAGECGQLNVTWTFDNSNDDIAGFRIYYITDPHPIDQIPPTPPDLSVDPDADYGSIDVPCNPVCPSAATLTGLKSKATYNVIVESVDVFGNTSKCFPTAPSPDTKPSFSGKPAIGSAPAAPVGLRAPLLEMSGTQVTLHWNPVTLTADDPPKPEPSLKGYRVYRGTTKDFIPDDTAGTGNRLADETTVTVASFVDTFEGILDPACTVYYYKIKAVNTCGGVSAASAALKVTPPDNDKAPKAPTITSLVAGDDTSALILDWRVPAPDNTNSTPVLLKVYYKKATDTLWTEYAAIDLTTMMTLPMTVPVTGQTILTGLIVDTWYDIKVSAIDAAGECSNASDSIISKITTAACAPKIKWTTGTGMVRGGHFIYPGLTTTGTRIDNQSGRKVVGTDPDAVSDPDFIQDSNGDSRYITWVVDPLDCTPDSSNFDRQGFDYNDPPIYTTVSPGAKVDFFINKTGDQTNTPADLAYGVGVSSDPAPRSGDGNYHFPVFPLNTFDIDTARFCSGDYDFRVRAVDGEQYVAENTIPLTIKTGGIKVDSAVATITKISTPEDTHHIAELGLINTHPTKALNMLEMALEWSNFSAFLKKVELVDPVMGPMVLFEDTVLPIIETGSGTPVVFGSIPMIAANGGTATLRLTFTSAFDTIDSTVDMRGATVTGTFSTIDLFDPSFNCLAPVGDVTLSPGPQIVTNATFQDEPVINTAPSILPVTNKDVVAGETVGLSTVVADTTGNPTYSVTSAKVFYAIDAFTGTTPPTRPSTTGGGTSYPNMAALSLEPGGVIGSNGKWSGQIPAMTTAARVWYYFEVFDADGNFDILPDVGAYTYVQCDAVLPSISFTPAVPAAGTISGPSPVTVTVEVNASSAVGIKGVTFIVTGSLGIPTTIMTEVSPGVYSGTYTVPAQPDPPVDLSHTLKVTATDQCGNQASVSRNYN